MEEFYCYKTLDEIFNEPFDFTSSQRNYQICSKKPNPELDSPIHQLYVQNDL